MSHPAADKYPPNGGGRRGIPWRLLGWGTAAALLLLPLIAMQFTDDVDWTGSDFAFAAILIGGVGLGLEFAFRRSVDPAYRIATGLALAATFFLIWIDGAVGIIGDTPTLALLAGPAVALVGSLLAGLRPGGMAFAMIAAAVLQAVAPAIAQFMEPGLGAAVWAPEVIASTVVLAGMWLVSAGLFRKAAARS